MNRLHRIEVLLRAADSGSFARAARTLGVTPSAVSRAIAALEEEMRVALFHRTTRSLRLTPEGEELYRHGKQIVDRLGEVESALSRAAGRLSGTLRVGLSVPLNRHIIMPAIGRFMARHPNLRLECLTLTQPAEMHASGVDVLLRVGELPDSNLIARHLASLHFVTCASPEYLKNAPPLRHPPDLRRHRCLVHQPPHEPKPFDRWMFEKDGVRRVIDVRPALFTNDKEGMITAAVNGAGVVRIGMFDPALIATGRLQRVLPEWRCLGSQKIYALYRKTARGIPKVSRFIDFAAEAMRAFDPEELTVSHLKDHAPLPAAVTSA